MMYLDGVWTFEQEKATFHYLSSPSSSELPNLLKTIAQRVVKLLEKQGLIVPDQRVEDKYLDLKSIEPMDHIHASSITYQKEFLIIGERVVVFQSFSLPKGLLKQTKTLSLFKSIFVLIDKH